MATLKSLEIQTKSIETTLVPLVRQITTLVNFKEKSRSIVLNEKTLNTINRVGESVHAAIQRFVSVGETIGNENPEIKSDLIDACRDVRSAGESIKRLTCIDVRLTNDRQSMVQAARALLSAVTRVLLLADMVVVKQIINTKKQVMSTLNRLENVTTFSEFVKLFAIYGNQMVDLAHLTGDRQNDLKDERRRSQLSASRTILEKSTLLILTSSKAYLRHADCSDARHCRDIVYSQIRHALDLVQIIVLDSGSIKLSHTANLTILLTKNQMNFVKYLKQFESAIEMLNVSLSSTNRDELKRLYENMIDNTQDFTDSIYVTNEEKEKIFDCQERIDKQLEDLNQMISEKKIESLSTIQQTIRNFRQQLEQITVVHCSEFFRTHDENTLLNQLKTYSLTNRNDLLAQSIVRFRQQADLAIELSKFLKHISSCEQLQVTSEYHEQIFPNLSAMIISSVQSLIKYPNSQVEKENFDVLCRFWQDEINDFSILVKEIQESNAGRGGEKTVYLSLPRPGKHGTTSKVGFKPTKLDSDEQAKLAKTGLELKLLTSEMDAEAEKWSDQDNEILKRAKNLSSMAFSMYLFTRGEGTLRTTQDLFTQAYYFVEEGARLSSIIQQFSNQITNQLIRQEFLIQLEQIPLMCHQLKLKLKSSALGKSPTFSKVDTVITQIRDLLTLIIRLCSTIFELRSKYNIIDSVSSRPPLPKSKRDARLIRSSSLQRPKTYLPAFDHI